ncbi:MAG: beta-N-acetylhexosaminidase [Clostridia bacterium]|nr:beta-N-acetylhexosaminidase [Clostridia bacterium]
MINVIPKPVKCEEKYGEFIINSSTSVYADDSLGYARDRLIDIIEQTCGYRLNVVVSTTANICFFINRKIADEGYEIDCDIERMNIFASTKAGALYAVQTIRQLVLSDLIDKPSVLTMHAVKIEDHPRYSWRGLMLDESRHFYGPEAVKNLLDMMVMHKLNVLHWHLTDNTGWRVEIKGYPKLTQIGSYRAGTQSKAWGNRIIDWNPHEGFYTQNEIKEIVSYAARRSIMIVPEIDMPAHLAAAIASYPELGCFNKSIEPFVLHSGNNPGEIDIIACAGKDFTYKFIYDVIDELSKLFPAPYFHIGGDEAPKTEWTKCPNCQKMIEDNKLKDEEDLQGYFNNKIAVYLKRKGKRLIAWNEILKSDNLENSIIAQYWTAKNDPKINSWLDDGKNVIISKHQSFYFDMPYSKVNLKDTYNFDEEKYGIRDHNKAILGVEGTIWTEWVPTQQRLDFQLYPRMEALSEVAWTPRELLDYKEFLVRLNKFLPTLKSLGKVFCPINMVDSNKFKGSFDFITFLKRNAHFEYNKAMAYRKRRRY